MKSWAKGKVNLVQVNTSKAKHLQHPGVLYAYLYGLTFDIKPEDVPWLGLFFTSMFIFFYIHDVKTHVHN